MKFYPESIFTYSYIEIIPTVFAAVKNYLEINPNAQLPAIWADLCELDEEIRDYVNLLGVRGMPDWSDDLLYPWS